MWTFNVKLQKQELGLGLFFFLSQLLVCGRQEVQYSAYKVEILQVIKQFGLPWVDLSCFGAYFLLSVKIITADLRASERRYCLQKY